MDAEMFRIESVFWAMMLVLEQRLTRVDGEKFNG